MKDFNITLKDSAGRTHALFVNEDNINELVRTGVPLFEAEELEINHAFEVAVRMGDIGADAWIQG